METKVTSPAIKGLIIGLVLTVLGLITVYTSQTENTAMGILPMVIFIGGIIWGCINYANQMDRNVTFGNVFGHGFKITAAVIVIMVIYTLLLFLVLKPELKDMALEKTRESMEKQNRSQDEIETAISMTKRLFMPFAVGGIILIYGIVGCIAALIGGAVAKKNPQPNPF
jgi:NADH:ubiquinone oxidoreductase subunit 6 (subunit J)